MPKVLLQITEDDIRKELEVTQTELSDESLQELFDTVSSMSVEDIVVAILTQYAEHAVKERVEECLSCPDVKDCELGKHYILEGMEALGKKPITLSGRN